jgi:U3 small nucleolar RNA-associated protein 10
MNAETLLQVFLPYHSSPNFPRILAILTIPATSPWSAPFAPLIKTPQIIPRSYITTAISPDRERSLRLLGDVVGMIRTAIVEGTVHRALLGFWTGVMVELLEKAKLGKVNESLVKVLVEEFVHILTTSEGGQDVNVSDSIIAGYPY